MRQAGAGDARDEDVRRLLHAADLIVYGLPTDWTGQRVLGGVERAASSEIQAWSVELCLHQHSSEAPDARNTSLCVTTSTIGLQPRRGPALLTLDWLLRRELGIQPPDGLNAMQWREWKLAPSHALRDYDVRRDEQMIDVAGRMTPFNFVEAGGIVAGRAEVGTGKEGSAPTITIVGDSRRRTQIALREVHDLQPYVMGREALLASLGRGQESG